MNFCWTCGTLVGFLVTIGLLLLFGLFLLILALCGMQRFDLDVFPPS